MFCLWETVLQQTGVINNHRLPMAVSKQDTCSNLSFELLCPGVRPPNIIKYISPSQHNGWDWCIVSRDDINVHQYIYFYYYEDE